MPVREHSSPSMSTAEPRPGPQAEITTLPSGFEALYADHYDFLWRCALRLGAPPADVEDVVHETFVVALRRYEQSGFEGPGAARPSTWLFAILQNVLRNHARSERRRQARLELLAADQPSRSASSMRAEASLGLRLLDEFLIELEPDRRAVFVLAELEGMRSAEIARALGVNQNTIRSRLRAARHAFDHRFGDEGERLVERANGIVAPPEARASGLALLGLSTASPSIAAKGLLIGFWGARGLLGAMLTSVVVLGAAVVAKGSKPEPSEVVESSSVPGPTSDRRATAPGEAPTEPIVVEAQMPSSSKTGARLRNPGAGVPQAESRDFEAEAREKLSRARRALLDGDASTALALVEASDGWPAMLDAHRVALEIGALCMLDRSEQARARAQAWQLSHPDASTAIALRAACWDGNGSGVGGHSGP
jgi:RNA polymerase sigma factor (sigma-70 family)